MEDNKTVLIVDDEEKNRKILVQRLKKNYDLTEASNGHETLQLLKDGLKPAVILLDIMMPDMDGYEVARHINQVYKNLRARIIFVSGRAMIDEKLEGYNAGGHDYVTKPFRGAEIRAKVAVFCELHNNEQKLKHLNENLEKEVKQRVAQIIKSEQAALVGMKASEIVHNIKNPLTVISITTDLLITRGNPAKDKLQIIQQKLKDISHIVKNVLSIVNRTHVEHPVPIVLDEAIKTELSFLNLYSTNTKIKIDPQLDCQSVIHWVPSHLGQVLGNLLKNSVEAIGEHKIGEIQVSSGVSEGKAWVEISDNGPGIPKEIQEDIFQQGFTTKDGQKGKIQGSGLGLSFCRRVMDDNQGSLTLVDQDEGAKFRLEFSLNKSPSKAA